MASDLQAQLQKIAAAAGIHVGNKPRGKPSLLYTLQEAADIGLQDVYEVALQGFEQLCRLDPRFQSYRRTLFGQASQSLDRDQQTADVNAKLDASIASFCNLLSSYFLMPAAFKALEYLIRRFKVHKHNVADLMRAALPYHATNEFVKLVQVLRLERTLFEFLAPMQKSGAALPRDVLVQRCLVDRGFLRFMTDTAQELAGPRVAAHAAMPLYAAVLCEVLARVQSIDEGLVAMLLPYLLAGLRPDVVADYRSATYMALVQLATRTTMSADLLAALITEMCKSLPPAGLPQALLVLGHLAATQPHFTSLPDRGFKHLAKLPGLAQALGAAAERTHRLAPLVGLMTEATATHVTHHANYQQLAEELIAYVPLGSSAQPLAAALLSQAEVQGAEGAEGDALVRVLQALDQRYPGPVEGAVVAAMQRHGEAPTHQEGEDTAAAVAHPRERLLAVLQVAFAGSVRGVLPEAGTTLSLAVDAASAALRRLALEKLDALALADAQGEGGETAAFLRSALLRRLADDSGAVVLTVLGLPSLLTIPPAALLDALAPCLASALQRAAAADTKRSERGESRAVARKVVSLLTGALVAHHPDQSDRVAELALGTVLVGPHTRKVAEAAIKGGKAVDHPLLQALKEVELQAPAAAKQEPAPNPKSKKSPKKKAAAGAKQPEEGIDGPSAADRAAADLAQNRAVIVALAQQAAGHEPARLALQRLLLSGEARTRALAAAVAVVCLRLVGGDALAPAVLAAALVDGPPSQPTLAVDPTTGELDDAGMASLAAGQLHAGALQPALVLAALEVLPTESVQEMGIQGLERLFVRLCGWQQSIASSPLHQLVAKAGMLTPSPEFLAGIWGLPADSGPGSAVQATALELWAAMLEGSGDVTPLHKPVKGRGSKTPAKATAAAAPQPVSAASDLLPRLLCVLGHPDRAVRGAALRCTAALASGVDVWWSISDNSSLTKAAAEALLQELESNNDAITADAEAAEWLLRHALDASDSDSHAAPPATKGRGAAAKRKGAASGTLQAQLHLKQPHAAAVTAFLLEQLPLQRGSAGLAAALFALRVVHDAADGALLLLAAHRLLRSFAFDGDALCVLRSQLEQDLAAELVGLYSQPAVSAALGGADAQEGAALLETLLAVTAVPGPEGADAARAAGLRAITPGLYDVLPAEAQRSMFTALMVASSRDAHEGGRAAARASLAALPLTADTLLPLLTVTLPPDAATAGGGGSAARGRRRRLSSSRAADSGAATQGHHEEAGHMDTCIATLEVLQWKDDVADALALVPQLQTTLGELLEAAGAGSGSEGSELTLAGTAGELSTSAAYAMQLILSLLVSLASPQAPAALVSPVPATATKAGRKGAAAARPAKPQGPFDLAVAVRCAQQAPNGAVRNAALALVAQLAAAEPQAALGHVLSIVAVVAESAAGLTDAHSNQVAARTLGAVARAWVQGGSPVEELISAVVVAVPGIPPPRRLPVAVALVQALSQVEGLAQLTQALLLKVLEAGAFAGSGAEAAGADGDWASSLAKAVMQQAPQLAQVQAMTALLQSALQRDANNAAAPLPMLATAFVTTQLRGAPPPASSEDAAELQGAYKALMHQALMQLQRVGELSQARGKQPSPTAAERLEAAADATYKLLQALQRVMDPVAYLSGLVALIGGGVDKVRRRALGLLSSRIAAEKAAADGTALPEEVAEAALAACQPAVALLAPSAAPSGCEPASDLTRQVALGTLGMLAQAFGAQQPQPFLVALPQMLSLIEQHERPVVRASGLACVAATAQALGPRLVPLLPATAKGVLAAAQAAAEALETDDAEGDEPSSEASSLELAAALSALSALVASLGAFLAPHLVHVLSVVLHPAVLACTAARCASTAASIRSGLAEGIPARLLLPPLVTFVDAAAAAGATATCELLSMLGTVVQRMDASAVASYHESIFAFLLRVLDLRRHSLAAGADAGDADRVEAAAVAAFVELTLRLSENKFKPLLFRLVDWGTSRPPTEAGEDADAGALTRRVALFAVANALAERLRSVFTPYFSALLEPAAEALARGTADAGTAAAAASSKKRKKAASAAPRGEHAVLEAVLKLKVVRALHRCFLYDAGNFLDDARFERLLPPLVAQLHAAPLPAALPALEADLPGDGGALESGLDPAAASLDVPARAVVACLAQMAVAAGSGDARWRPLNHAVLMATRSQHLRTRLAGLEAAASLARALNEEYLPLLPEALPFLAELLEDVEAEVEARAAGVLRALEELSGEDLKGYLKG